MRETNSNIVFRGQRIRSSQVMVATPWSTFQSSSFVRMTINNKLIKEIENIVALINSLQF